MWSSVPFFLPFRACCCPSEVINGFVMYESVIASVCCLVWIAHISSSFMPSVLTVRRHDKAVLPFGFSPRYSKQVYNYVLQKHKEDRRNPFTLCRKKANGLKKLVRRKPREARGCKRMSVLLQIFISKQCDLAVWVVLKYGPAELFQRVKRL